MASPTAGITLTWNSVTFNEVVDLKFTHGGNLPVTRSGVKPFSFDLGAIDVVCLGTANCSVLNYGKRATFQVQGPGVAFTHKAIFERLAVEMKLNDVERHTVTLRFAQD